MNKKYVQPSMEVIEMEAAEMIAQSSPIVSDNPADESTIHMRQRNINDEYATDEMFEW